MENKRKGDGGYRRLQGGCGGDKRQRKEKSENEWEDDVRRERGREWPVNVKERGNDEIFLLK